MNYRKGMTVAKVGEHDGKACVLESHEHGSINAAKRANGLNARVLKRGESFPPHKATLIAEAAEKEKEAA
jgi:hypothetical protein